MNDDETVTDLTAGDSVLVVCGSFNGQGHATDMRWYSTRTLTIVSLAMGFLLVSAYGALIVRSLLSTPAPNIRNRKDFMESPLKLAVENFYHFKIAVFGEGMDVSTRKLYEAKVAPPKGGGYRELSDSFEGVLAEKWALLARTNNLRLEMAKATPSQVCRLSLINEVYPSKRRGFCPVISKKSEMKSLLSRGHLLIKERGLDQRADMRHQAPQILCLAEQKRQWVPVKLRILIAAISVLFVGLIAAFIIFVTELYTSVQTFNFGRTSLCSPVIPRGL